MNPLVINTDIPWQIAGQVLEKFKEEFGQLEYRLGSVPKSRHQLSATDLLLLATWIAEGVREYANNLHIPTPPRFLTLHQKGGEVFIVVDKIALLLKGNPGRLGANVYFCGDNVPIEVDETPEEILKLIHSSPPTIGNSTGRTNNVRRPTIEEP